MRSALASYGLNKDKGNMWPCRYVAQTRLGLIWCNFFGKCLCILHFICVLVFCSFFAPGFVFQALCPPPGCAFFVVLEIPGVLSGPRGHYLITKFDVLSLNSLFSAGHTLLCNIQSLCNMCVISCWKPSQNTSDTQFPLQISHHRRQKPGSQVVHHGCPLNGPKRVCPFLCKNRRTRKHQLQTSSPMQLMRFDRWSLLRGLTGRWKTQHRTTPN
jgi:hypothetical protein